MPAALLVASTRGYADARETLRLQDTAEALLANGWSVDVLVARRSALLNAVLSRKVRVVEVPQLPMNPPPKHRLSCRRLVTSSLMVLRASALVSQKTYAVLHGFNDGASTARAIDRVTLRRFPYIADYTEPFGIRGMHRGFLAGFAAGREAATMRHASALIFAEADLPAGLEKRPPGARLSIIPDARDEIEGYGFTRAEFQEAILKIYDYVTREQ